MKKRHCNRHPWYTENNKGTFPKLYATKWDKRKMDEFWDAYDLWKLNKKEINKSIIRSKTEAIIMKTTTNFSSKKQALEQIDHRWILPELQGVADMKYYSNYFK